MLEEATLTSRHQEMRECLIGQKDRDGKTDGWQEDNLKSMANQRVKKDTLYT